MDQVKRVTVNNRKDKATERIGDACKKNLETIEASLSK
jgi:hypothetical protein